MWLRVLGLSLAPVSERFRSSFETSENSFHKEQHPDRLQTRILLCCEVARWLLHEHIVVGLGAVVSRSCSEALASSALLGIEALNIKGCTILVAQVSGKSTNIHWYFAHSMRHKSELGQLLVTCK